MGKIANLRIGNKLLLAFAVLILSFGAMLYFTLTSFTRLQQAEAQDFKRSHGRVTDLKEVLINIMGQRIALQQLLDNEAGDAKADLEADIRQRSERNDQLIKQVSASLADDKKAQNIFSALEGVRAVYAQTRDTQLLPLIRSGRLDEARKLFLGEQQERINKIQDMELRLVELSERRIQETLERAEQALENQRERLLLLGVVLLVGSGLLAWLLSRHIALPLARLTGWAEQISGGEIPSDMNSSAREDEVGRLGQAFTRMGRYLQELASKAETLAQGQLHEDMQGVSERDVLGRAFATMVSNLRGLVLELNESISVLAASSEEILATTTQVAASTQETATAISEITTTVEEVKQTAVLAGSKSQSVAESTERTRQVALGGRQAVEETLKGMSQIREQMQAVAESIMRLGEQSQTIGEIVASVNDLAEQSNLLGVNASIEAVKAGEAGKGFSVVAQEVKALAEQSKQATAQVRGILGDIQKAMTKAVLLAEQGSKSVEAGYERAQVSGEAIRTLDSSIAESSEVALQIAATSQQQMIGMDQIGSAMENIRQASQDNVGGARQVDVAARNLHQLGLKLKGLSAQFKL